MSSLCFVLTKGITNVLIPIFRGHARIFFFLFVIWPVEPQKAIVVVTYSLSMGTILNILICRLLVPDVSTWAMIVVPGRSK